MAHHKVSTLEELKAELEKDPKFRAAYKRLKPCYESIDKIIREISRRRSYDAKRAGNGDA